MNKFFGNFENVNFIDFLLVFGLYIGIGYVLGIDFWLLMFI